MTPKSNLSPTPKLSRWPFVLLGLMTSFSFGGPLVFGFVLAGGTSPRWPPDRPVEWATLIGISAAVVILMTACVAIGLINQKAMARAREISKKPEASRSEP
jgi:hypothetical protein